MLAKGSTTSDGLMVGGWLVHHAFRPSARRRVEQDAEDADRPEDVLDALFAEVLERDVEPVAHLVPHGGGNADSVRWSELLEARRHVDAIAEDIAVLDDHVAEVDADPELNPSLRRNIRVAPRHPALDLGGALDGVGDALEFHQHSVAGGLDDLPLVLDDDRIDDLEPVGPQPRERARLVGFHQPAVADHVRRENRRQPSHAAKRLHCRSSHRMEKHINRGKGRNANRAAWPVRQCSGRPDIPGGSHPGTRRSIVRATLSVMRRASSGVTGIVEAVSAR